MSPSLEQVYDKKVPLEERGEQDDIEDMSFTKVRLSENLPSLLRPYAGQLVKIGIVDPIKRKHTLETPDGTVVKCPNSKDIYSDEV